MEAGENDEKKKSTVNETDLAGLVRYPENEKLYACMEIGKCMHAISFFFVLFLY